MENIVLKIKDDKLIIEIDLSNTLRPSQSGKSDLIATTSGARFIEGLEEYGFKMALTIFKMDRELYKKRGYKEYISKNKKRKIIKRVSIEKG